MAKDLKVLITTNMKIKPSLASMKLSSGLVIYTTYSL